MSSECARNTVIDTLQVSYSCRLAFSIEADVRGNPQASLAF